MKACNQLTPQSTWAVSESCKCHWHTLKTLKTLNALEVPVVGRFHLGLSQAKVQKYWRNPVPYHRDN